MIQFVSQITLCLMLVVTTGWCILVYRKLLTLKSDGGPIRELIQSLNEATKRADQTILAMRLVIRDADTRLSALAELDATQAARQVTRQPADSGDHARRQAVLAAAARQARADAQAMAMQEDARIPIDPQAPTGYELAEFEDRASAVSQPPSPPLERGRNHRRQRYEDVLRVHRTEAAQTPPVARAPARSPREAQIDPPAGRRATSPAELQRLAQSIASLR